MSRTDDRLAYTLSLDNGLHSVNLISRTHKLTPERSKTIFNAAAKIKSLRAIGEEHWNLIDRKLPPPFRELLFSDGDIVYSGMVKGICVQEADFIANVSYGTSKARGETIWWREMPKAPRELYGI